MVRDRNGGDDDVIDDRDHRASRLGLYDWVHWGKMGLTEETPPCGKVHERKVGASESIFGDDVSDSDL